MFVQSVANLARRFIAPAAFTVALTIGCVTTSFGQVQSPDHKRTREQIQADILAGARLPPIKPVPAPVDHSAIFLYPHAQVAGLDEQWDDYSGGRIVRNVLRPTLTPYLPDAAQANGAAVIVAPGGAFRYLVMEAEGATIARRLAERGIAAFVLKYRTEPSSRNSQQFVEELFELLARIVRTTNAGQAPVAIATPGMALEDARAAVALVRSRAAQWRVDPERVGFIGFSAGAFLALSVGLIDDAEARPDFIALLYGPTKIAEAPSYAPPMFLAAALDDPLFSAGTGNLLAAWSAVRRPVEAHFYEQGGHGFAKGTTSELWFDQFHAWIDRRGLLQKGNR